MAHMVSRGRGRRTINEINMVPFIDVISNILQRNATLPPAAAAGR